MLNKEDIILIEHAVTRVINATVIPRIEKLEQKVDYLELRIARLEKRVGKLEKEVKSLKQSLNETIDWFDKRHHANLKRFEKLEKYTNLFRIDDPLILYDRPSQNSPQSK